MRPTKNIPFIVIFIIYLNFCYQEVASDADRARIHQIHEDCVASSGVDEALPKKAMMNGEFAEDSKLKCYFKCFYEKLGYFDANGNIDITKILERLPPNVDAAKMKEGLDACKKEKGTDNCDTAFKFAKCAREIIKEFHKH